VLGWLTAAIDPADAEDCFQETMLAALRAYPRLRDASNLRGWLLTIAKRKVVDTHRARTRRPITASDEALQAAAGASQPAALADPEVWAAVRNLPDKQKRAVVMRYAGDRSYDDIAGAMATSVEAARQNTHAGLKSLRRRLQ
jgi:RNA polymerase sigma factor (sigma-70 family)